MLSISDGGSLAHALSSSIDHRLKLLLSRRRDQLGGDLSGQAHLVIAQPADNLDALQQGLGFSPLDNPIDGSRFGDPDFSPGWEWLADHGFCFELVFIFDDSGFAHVVLVPKEQGVDTELIALCSTYAIETL